MVRRHLLFGLAATLASLALVPAAHAALRFERCGGYGYQCARIAVPLDHSGAVPGQLTLRVQRLRSRIRPARGAVFVLAGGPGQSAATAFGGDAAGLLYAAYRSRDVIVFDQRGTGRSGALRCGSLERSDLLDATEAASRCATSLGARRGFYRTVDSVEDMEALRRALGIDRIAIYGTSYGTKVALEYALRHPTHVERLALDSVVGADGPDALYRDTFAAVPRALSVLCRVSCRSFTRDPAGDLERLIARLRERPMRGMLVDEHGRARPGLLTRPDVFGVLVAGDFDPALRAGFPGAVRSALAGDAAPMLRLRRRAFKVEGDPPPPRVLSAALYAATSCEETAFPWARTSPPDPAARLAAAGTAVSGLPASVFSPFDRGTVLRSDLLALCAGWPAASPAPAPVAGPFPDVPVLMLEGEDDLRTPVEGARRVAASFPQARLVISASTGHSALGSDPSVCARRAFDRFFRGTAIPSRCPPARRLFRPTGPAPRRLSAVRAIRGLPGPRGRTLAAIGLTLRDVIDDAVTELIFAPDDPDLARGGGLRRGSYRIGSGGTLVLRDLAYVPGVRVSGRIRRFGERRQRGSLRVRGPGVPQGRLRLRGREVRGPLGGRRVRARLTVDGADRARAARAAAAAQTGGASGAARTDPLWRAR
ncbi:MAG: alpha/beta fold hydrolase [Thermoleophilaceae bacterium]|nr:alpha/beta fold hydrolase [Thermoleophilaceae bacterium]